MSFDFDDVVCKKIAAFSMVRYYCQRCDLSFVIYDADEFYVKSIKKSKGGIPYYDQLCECPKCDKNNRLMFYEKIC